jgi:hypothetical protein
MSERECCNALERSSFLGDAWADYALAFIEQQDVYGWSDAWADYSIETHSTSLQWYKALKAGTSDTAHKRKTR